MTNACFHAHLFCVVSWQPIMSAADALPKKFVVATWFVIRDNAPNKRHCKLCDSAYALTSANSTLKRHVQGAHPIAFERGTPALPVAASAARLESDAMELSSVSGEGAAAAAAAAPSSQAQFTASVLQKRSQTVASLNSSECSSAAPRPLKQQKLTESNAAAHNKQLAKAVALCFASNHIAYNVADSASFAAMLEAARGSTIVFPKRTAVKTALGQVEASLREQVIARITGGTAPVTVAIDGWTNVLHTKVTNVVLLCSGNAFYWCSLPNAAHSNTADWLRDHLTPVLEGLVAAGIRFSALVADNEAVNDALFRRLQDPFPFLIRVPCAAHTMQLVVNQIISLAKFSKVYKVLAGVLSSFDKSRDTRNQLRTMQRGDAEQLHEYALIKPCDTRWNSKLRACKRFILLRRYLQFMFPAELKDSFWTELELLIDYLQPFQIATDVLQRDSATLFDVWQQRLKVLAHIQQGKAKYGAAVTRQALGALNQRWQEQTNRRATIAVALLSFVDAEAEGITALLNDATDFIIEFGQQYLCFFHVTSAAADPDMLRARLQRELGEFLGRTGDFTAIGERLRTARVEAASFSPMNIWAGFPGSLLTLVAKALLSVTASEAAVERSFSAQDSVHTKRRNRLLDRSVQTEMFVKFNHRALENSSVIQYDQRGWKELLVEQNDEDESSDQESVATDVEDEPVEPAFAPAAAAETAPAAAGSFADTAGQAPVRSFSEIDDGMRTFLLDFMDRHGVTLSTFPRWRRLRDNKLILGGELTRLPFAGGFMEKDALAAMAALLDEQNQDA